LRFCQRDSKPCPLLASFEPGDPCLPALDDDLDIRTGLPRYRVWRGDLLSFLLGCSFSFEEALLAARVPVRRIEPGCNVPMHRTNILTPAAGTMVVSMRPADAIRAVQVTSRFPSVHGAPVHLGLRDVIGIADLARPDYGDPVDIHPGELRVFWACGVTPQSVVAASPPAFCIIHAPGCMLVTDLLNAHLAVI